jgi:hypothetical protein
MAPVLLPMDLTRLSVPSPAGQCSVLVATVVVGDGGTIVTSTDGVTWEPRPSIGYARLRRVVWTGDAFVAVGSGGTAVRSTDDVSWTAHPTPYLKPLFGSDPFDLNDAVWTGPGGRLVVVGTRRLVATSP